MQSESRTELVASSSLASVFASGFGLPFQLRPDKSSRQVVAAGKRIILSSCITVGSRLFLRAGRKTAGNC